MDAHAVFWVIQRDRDYYLRSGGGVTISGGEPMLHPEFLLELLRLCKKAGIHTAVNTASHIPWKDFERVLPMADLILTDLKVMDSTLHRKHTGAGNERILKNIQGLLEQSVPLYIRIPLIDGVNTARQNIADTAEFIKGYSSLLGVELLPYHNLGVAKSRQLWLRGIQKEYAPPASEAVDSFIRIFKACGIAASWQ